MATVVDDCLLFCEVDHTNCNKLKNVLDHFCAISGQFINYHKSVLTFSRNASNVHKQTVVGIFHIMHSNLLGKSLACPNFQGNPVRLTFHETISKAT